MPYLDDVLALGLKIFRSNDPTLSFLAPFGYNAIRLPRAGIAPLQVFEERNNELTKLGELIDLFDESVAKSTLPRIKRNVTVANISGQNTGDIEFGAGFSILKAVVSNLGGSTLGLDGKYLGINSVSFQYDKVLEDSIDSLLLDKFLDEACGHLSCSISVHDLLESEKVFVTSSILKSASFTFVPKMSKDSSVNASLSEIQGIIGSNVTARNVSGDSKNITFEGKKPIVFGYKAVKLSFDKKSFTGIKIPHEPTVMKRKMF